MSIFSDDIEEGEEVMFTTSLPTAAALTRTEPSYTAPKENYKFTIGMYTDDTHKVGEGIYNTIINDEIGTLKAEKPLYWHSTQIAYGFKATAGTTDLEADQTTEEKWLLDLYGDEYAAYKKRVNRCIPWIPRKN